jgi:hypothetical protein
LKALGRGLHVLRLGEHDFRRLGDEVHVNAPVSADLVKLIGAALKPRDAPRIAFGSFAWFRVFVHELLSSAPTRQ